MSLSASFAFYSSRSFSVSVSFLKNRFTTRLIQCSTDPVFDETFLFEFVGDNEEAKFDASALVKFNQHQAGQSDGKKRKRD